MNILNTIINFVNAHRRPLILAGSLIISLVSVTVVLLTRLSSQAQNDVYVTFGVNKTQAVPGEEITYTLYVKNRTTANLANVSASTSIDSKAAYVAGSSVFYKAGQQLVLPDSWLQDRLNMGTIIPDQENKIVYRVLVPASLAVGTVIHGSGQIQPEGQTAQTYGVDTTVVSPSQTTNFRTGDLFQGVNNTTGGTWADPVAAVMGDVIEFKVRIVNDGQLPARNTSVYVQLAWDPQNPSNSLVSRATLDADNADPATDTATVNLTGLPSYLWPRDGHYNIIGVTDLYNCPNGCPITRSFMDAPKTVGEIAPGGSVEIQFKADVKNLIQPTPTPTPTPTGTLTPTLTPTVTPTPTGILTLTPTSPPATPTMAQVVGAAVPEAQPQAGFNSMWLLIAGGVGIVLRLILIL